MKQLPNPYHTIIENLREDIAIIEGRMEREKENKGIEYYRLMGARVGLQRAIAMIEDVYRKTNEVHLYEEGHDSNQL